MSGLSRYIRELDPLCFYTFDPKYSFITDDFGVYINRTELDFVPLQVNHSWILYPNRVQYVFHALSYIEDVIPFKSFGTGSYDMISAHVQWSNRYYSFNNATMYIDTDFSDHKSIIEANDIYTVSFQLQAISFNNVSSTLPYCAPFTLNPRVHFGFELSQNFDFDAELIVGGYSELSAHIITGFSVYANLSLMGDTPFNMDDAIYGVSSITVGYESIFALEVEFGLVGVVPEESKLWDEFWDGTSTIPGYENAAYSNPPGEYFSFSGFTIAISDTLRVYANRHDNSLEELYRLTSEEIITFFIEYDLSVNDARIYINDALDPVSTVHIPDMSVERLKLGYETKLTPATESLNIPSAVNLYKMHVSNKSVRYDNFVIFGRALTDTERAAIYSLNFDIVRHYIHRGYDQLYQFNNYYDVDAVRHLEHNTILSNSLGGTERLQLTATNELPHIKHYQNNPLIEYSLYLPNGSSLISMNGGLMNTPLPMVNSESFTISFIFKTSDLNGVLFANTNYVHQPSNCSLVLVSGNLQIWCNRELRITIGGMSNDSWRFVFITCDGTNTYFYIDSTLYYTYNASIYHGMSKTSFGSSIPGNRDLNMEIGLIGGATKPLSYQEIINIMNDSAIYSASGQITINNIAVGTNIYIYNRENGELIEKIMSSNEDGIFSYSNRFPFMLMIIISDNMRLDGMSYLVDAIDVT